MNLAGWNVLGMRVMWRNRDFLKLWVGQAVSASGSAITTVAMPLVAVVSLGASPVEMGLLSALTVVPHLVFGLPAGVWVNRLSRRRVMIVADLGRALLLGAIPVLSAVGLLRMEHLYVVAVLAGVLTLLSDTASMTLLPALVPRDDLMQANSASMLTQTVASTTGPSVAGVLAQVASAPFAIAVDAMSFVVSAVASFLIKEPARPVVVGRRYHLLEGLRELFGNPVLSALTLSAAIAAIAGAAQAPLVVLYLVRDLHWPPLLVGVTITVGGVSSVVATMVAPSYSRKLGVGRAYLSGQFLASLAGAALAAGWMPLVLLSQLLTGAGMPLYGVPQRTLRQALVPAHLLAQVTASWRTLVIGGQTVGAVMGGLAAAHFGVRPTLVLSSLGMLAGVAVAAWSPLRGLVGLPAKLTS
ncbi:MFS transporter [Kribbella qitaiheensis]|uniref:MFS transporter n=1 Tax=Kribbella qitaiheensis TaxID=1544730 RepID=A0A7G6X5S0_9ACTN|nr:MFS transporter [Kribbella qitaiheensis]QNE21585.1 MFS transporter [Kribbella qitaiheensis]